MEIYCRDCRDFQIPEVHNYYGADRKDEPESKRVTMKQLTKKHPVCQVLSGKWSASI